MLRFRRVAVALITAGAVVSLSQAQPPESPAQDQPATAKFNTSAVRPAYKRQSIVHHNAYPYPEHYYGDQSGGFRNPGHIGRYAEYYPPGGQYQNQGGGGASKAATFDRGGGEPSREEQIQAQQLGVQKYNAIQSHIDNYARSYIGFGVGGYGGLY